MIWENFNQKTINLDERFEAEKNGGWRAKICTAFSSNNNNSKITWLSSLKTFRKNRNKEYLDEDDEVNQKLNNCDTKSKTNAADEFRVHNEESLEKIHWQKQSEYCEGKISTISKHFKFPKSYFLDNAN